MDGAALAGILSLSLSLSPPMSFPGKVPLLRLPHWRNVFLCANCVVCEVNEWRGLFVLWEKTGACGMNVLAHAMVYAMMEWNVNGNRTGLGTYSEVQLKQQRRQWEVGEGTFSNVVGLGRETWTFLDSFH